VAAPVLTAVPTAVPRMPAIVLEDEVGGVHTVHPLFKGVVINGGSRARSVRVGSRVIDVGPGARVYV
jgi:hypothetical protein